MDTVFGLSSHTSLFAQTSTASTSSGRNFHHEGTRTGKRGLQVSRCAFKTSKSPPRQVKASIEAINRRDMIYGGAAAAILPLFTRPPAAAAESPTRQEPDTTITDVVYLDVGYCPAGANPNRTLGDSAVCKSTDALGRIIVGLYGHAVPTTVANFVKLVRDGAYTGTVFSKVLPGEYIEAGRQGSPRLGEVKPPTDLAPNRELLDSQSFRLEHSRPGTVSIAIAENDDDPLLRQRTNYRYTEFLITTGPGPVPSLDGQNVVIGTVLEGYQTLAKIASQQTFKPNERIQQVNKLASLIGDDRAARTRAKYGKPLKPVVMTDVGVLPIREPFARPF